MSPHGEPTSPQRFRPPGNEEHGPARAVRRLCLLPSLRGPLAVSPGHGGSFILRTSLLARDFLAPHQTRNLTSQRCGYRPRLLGRDQVASKSPTIRPPWKGWTRGLWGAQWWSICLRLRSRTPGPGMGSHVGLPSA